MMNGSATRTGHNSGHLFAQLGNIEHLSPDRLHPYANNPRRHNSKQLAKIAASIVSFGFNVPVLTDDAGQIVAGEARWLAAKDLGLDTIPVLPISHLSEDEIRAFRIADNRLSELGLWDEEKLALDFAAIIDAGTIGIDLSGFETAEIDILLEKQRNPGRSDVGGGDPADAPLERQSPISVTGDLWQLGSHRLCCGSSRDDVAWQQLLDGKTAAMVFTDPPYNVPMNGHVSGTGRHREFAEASGEMSSAEFEAFLGEAIEAATAYLRDGGIADICMDFRHLPELYAAAARSGLATLNLCVWNKSNGGMGSLYRSKHELVLITKKGKAPHINNVQLGRHGRYRTNVWDYAGVNSFGKNRAVDLADHPTVKPIALVADAIRDVTHPGDIVLDGFMGSGTTLLAAERCRRIGYGFEIDGGYVDVAIRRWEAMTGREATLAATGESFAAVRERRTKRAEHGDDRPRSEPVIRRRPVPVAA